jgi:membrane-associated protein
MSYFLTVFLSYVLIYKYATLIIFLFVGAFLLPLPSNALLLAVGALSTQGYFNIFVCWAVALTTNILADIFGYYLTHKYGVSIFRFLHINTGSEKFHKVEKWIKEYAGEAIFFTRITSPFAATVNFLSGLIGVPFKKFLLMDVLGNFIDISAFVFIGYFLGNYWQTFLGNLEYLGILISIVFIVSIFVRIYWKKVFSKI